ncbi:MAG: gamma-glutamylcyclotransferase family protein [Kofleriaceae bacterium]
MAGSRAAQPPRGDRRRAGSEPPKIRTPDSFEVERTTGSHEILNRLFVYGTLRAGQTARSLVANSVERCEPARASGYLYAFPMGYPGFIEGPGTVVGEVCWLGDLAATFSLLDAYEGDDFTRVIRKVTLADGSEVWAWIYLLTDARAAELGELIADGDWVRYWSAQIE